jgi:hypothetical protein
MNDIFYSRYVRVKKKLFLSSFLGMFLNLYTGNNKKNWKHLKEKNKIDRKLLQRFF